jgi:hypothetical protein
VAKGNLGQKDIIYLCIFRISFCWKNEKKNGSLFLMIDFDLRIGLIRGVAFGGSNLKRGGNSVLFLSQNQSLKTANHFFFHFSSKMRF